MNIILIFFSISLFLIVIKFLNSKEKDKNKKLSIFKKNFLSTESNIEKIFTRDDERTSSDPNINIKIGLYDNEDNIKRKSNIHRARLSKFKKSRLNGEIIFIDQDQKIFKYINGKRIYI